MFEDGMFVQSYDPYDWYWIADDGRLFSSKTQTLVPADNADYVMWTGLRAAPGWPRDHDGNQTDAALQSLLTQYEIFVNLTYYNAFVRDNTLGGGITVNGLPFATDPVTTMSLNSAYIYTQANAGATFSWKLPDGSFVTLGKQDISALQNGVARFGQDCYACEDTTLTGIETGTVTERSQIDAAFAAVPKTFTGVTMADRRHIPK